MATPAFIYAFDNLGPDRFTELCGTLLGKRFSGFGLLIMGGVGPDGGIDAEIESDYGILSPESESGALGGVFRPGETVIFQFKHKVVARVGGQSKARTQLLSRFQHDTSTQCELCRNLVAEKKPTKYVLVTNVEVNSYFREKFKFQCLNNHPEIGEFQVLGIDELENWVYMEPHIRHLYFPTIFGFPRYDLKVDVSSGGQIRGHTFVMGGQMKNFVEEPIMFLQVTILNIGTATSYVNMQSVLFKTTTDGKSENLKITSLDNDIVNQLNPFPDDEALEPGRKRVYRFPMDIIDRILDDGSEVFIEEIIVRDEIDNEYLANIPDEIRMKLIRTP